MITLKDVEHVAKLARLGLTEEEKEKFAGQLSSIISYVEQLNEVNTEGVEPMAHAIEFCNVFREDKVDEAGLRKELLSNAPQEEDGYFRVPRIAD